MNPLAHSLAQGIAAMNLPIGDAEQQKLLHYLELLKKWNKTYNLTALRDEQKMVSHHILDSLTLLPYTENIRSMMLLPYTENIRSMIDVGSGGGMPGIPTAICRPDVSILLLDANTKKTTFLQQAVIELGLKNVTVSSSRVEALHGKTADIITSRAFAELRDFVELTRQLLHENSHWVAMKGVYPTEELARLPKNVEAYQIDPLTVPTLDAERHMVLLRPTQGATA